MENVHGDVSRRELLRAGAAALVGGAAGIGLWGCGGTNTGAGVISDAAQDDGAAHTRMIGSDRRMAVVYETYYALRSAYRYTPGAAKPTGGGPIWNSECVSNWNYIGDDPISFAKVQPIVGGMSNASVANDPAFGTGSNYGCKNGYGRGGQCTYFACLILYRALNGFSFSTNTNRNTFYWPDLLGANYPSSAGAVPGDLVFASDGSHIAVCVGASDGKNIDVVDSNYLGTTSDANGGKTWEVGRLTPTIWSSEIIGRHTVAVSAYKLITGDAKKNTNLPHRRWYNL